MKNYPLQQIIELTGQDLVSLLDEISRPSVLIKYDTGIIISSNYLFAEKFFFKSIDFKGESIHEVIKGINLANISDGETQTVSYINRNNDIKQTQIQIKFISLRENLIVVSLLPEEIEKRNSVWYWKRFTLKQNYLTANFTHFTYKELLSLIVTTGKEITDYEETVIFVKNDSSGFLELFSLNKTVFPENIPEIEIKRIREIDFWEPGKRVLSEIHRVGRLNKFNSIITIPISNDEKILALVILASLTNNPKELDQDLLHQFKSWASFTIIKFFEDAQISKKRKQILLNLEKLEIINSHMSDSFLIVDENNKILEFNSNFQQLFNYLPIEILNKPLDQVIQNSELIMQVKTATITENRPKKLEVLDRNGKKRWIEARVIPVLQKGKNNKIILIIDESEKWAANNTVALLQKNAVLGEIISEFAHDVRNIINRLTTGLQLLAKRMELNDEGLLSIQELKGECANMTELMDSVLSYSKQNFENFQQINIYELINQNIYKLQKKAKTNNVSLILNSDNPDCKIIADPRSIERVITNLINNGIEAIGAYGGAVSISLSSNEGHPGYLCVQIADTGPGIPPEIEGKLFQKFSTGKVEGTGLGLFITQKIIEFHRGWIDFDTFPGGTIFNIYLPNEQLGEHL